MNLRRFQFRGCSRSCTLKVFIQVQKEICSRRHRTLHLKVSRRSSAVGIKEMKCTKKSDARTELFFCP